MPFDLPELSPATTVAVVDQNASQVMQKRNTGVGWGGGAQPAISCLPPPLTSGRRTSHRSRFTLGGGLVFPRAAARRLSAGKRLPAAKRHCDMLCGWDAALPLSAPGRAVRLDEPLQSADVLGVALRVGGWLDVCGFVAQLEVGLLA